MREKKFSFIILSILAISFASMGLILSPSTSKRTELPDYMAVDISSGLAGDIVMPEITESAEKMIGSGSGARSVRGVNQLESTPPVGTTVYDWYLDAMSGGTAYTMTLRALSGNVEIWVQDDMSFPIGDPRNSEPWDFEINDAMCQYLADEFNNVIYPIDSTYFGVPLDRDGTGTIFEGLGWPAWIYDWIETDPYNPQRVILKILNYRDTNYFNPSYPYYVAGFYSSTYTGYYNRNMIHLDSWEFWKRLGPAGTSWLPAHPSLVVAEDKAHQYEGTTSHEFQHLIHRDYQSDPAAFMNEGCSMFAEMLCGYGIPWGDINSYLATPDNSLTAWEDQGGINVLADYGVAALWSIYLNDRFGSSFLSNYVRAGIPGIAGINAALYPLTFNEVFKDWKIANYLHTDQIGHGKYNYKSINLGSEDAITIASHSILLPHSQFGTDFGNTITILDYDTGIAKIGPYGSDYIVIENLDDFKGNKLFSFNGDDGVYLTWEEVEEGVWYSGAYNLYEALLVGEASIPEDGMLEFTTYFDIEDYWDFGFVQVSTDDGATWTSLENDYTTEYHEGTHPNIIPHLPGITGWSGYYVPYPYWMTMNFDLSTYAGQDVLIGFRYMTDWFTTYEGWYVTEVSVDGVPLDLYPVADLIPIDWQVTLIYYKETANGKGMNPYTVKNVRLNDFNDGFRFTGKAPDQMVAIVSPINYEVGFADYWFSISDW
ncbi:MAG: hypothetical protein ACFFCQ_16265 [Promethearchaeota archaeon]